MDAVTQSAVAEFNLQVVEKKEKAARIAEVV